MSDVILSIVNQKLNKCYTTFIVELSYKGKSSLFTYQSYDHKEPDVESVISHLTDSTETLYHERPTDWFELVGIKEDDQLFIRLKKEAKRFIKMLGADYEIVTERYIG